MNAPAGNRATRSTPESLISREAFLRGSAGWVVALSSGGFASRAAMARAASGRVALNVRVSHDRFGSHGEPSVAINPRDNRNLLVACMVMVGTLRGLATFVSFDRGATWRSNGLLREAPPDYDADVTVQFDSGGRGFVCGWVGNRQSQGGVRVWRSNDGGRTFAPPVEAVKGFMDHPGLAADPSAGSRRLFLAGTFSNSPRNGLAFTHSPDGGHTFGVPRFLDAHGIHPAIAAGSDGAVAIMYTTSLPDGNDRYRVIASTDHGKTFRQPVDLVDVASAVSTLTRSGPAIAAAPNRNALYAAVAAPPTAARRSQIRLFASHDKGRRWLAFAILSHTANATLCQPQLAVAEDGRVAVSAFALEAGRVSVLLFISDANDRFKPAKVVTTRAFDPGLGTVGGWIGDYQGLAVRIGMVHPVWNDTRTGRLELFTAAVPLDAAAR